VRGNLNLNVEIASSQKTFFAMTSNGRLLRLNTARNDRVE